MSLELRQPSRLDPAQQESLLSLVQTATETDQSGPLNEEALLRLDDPSRTHLVAEVDHQLAGYAQHDPGSASSQLVVHPHHRRRGLGRALLERLLAAAPATAVWAFGDGEPAQRLLSAYGFAPQRRLLVLHRALDPGLTRPGTPPGVVIRGFQPGDETAVLAVNAAAFADHPEQGRLDLPGLRQRMAQDWFDPAGLLLALGPDQAPLGLHWTKRHSAELGEVYVIGVTPRATGQGLGRTLLDTGLAYLASTGCREVQLWVEADNEAAVGLYRSSGFTVAHSDVCYARKETL
ncbi:MAG: mycothiol synthase [Actinomycetia bacterium]|nr:mycothiol synthase [Actinomycetes bacterium]